MKKIIGYMLIAAFFMSQQVQANLLTGPYSPESQELVKLAQNPALPIPENLKNKKDLIELFRSWLSGEFLFLNDKNTALIKDRISLEAAIQAIMLTPPQKNDKSTLEEQHLVLVYLLARAQKNNELLALVIKAMPQKMRDSLIRSEVAGLAISYRSSKDRKRYEDQKELVKLLIAQNASSAEVIKESLYTVAMLMLYQKDMEEFLNFILSLGLPINYIDPQASSKKETLLDVANNGLKLKEFKDDKDLIATREYLISKGAKTYAELQSK